MIVTFLLLLAICFIAIGLLFIVESAFPRFGGGTEPIALPIGIAILALGLWLIFKAGTIL